MIIIDGWRSSDSWTIFADAALLPSGELVSDIRVTIHGDAIEAVEHGTRPHHRDLYIPSSLLSLGLGNAHDHLKYHWPQLLGGRVPNSYEWIPILQEEAARTFFKWASVRDLYWLGVYANIMSGVTTVINHARRPPVVSLAEFGVDIPTDFRRELMVDVHRNEVVWEHRMGAGAVEESLAAKAENRPFVVHAAEGVDDSTAGEIALLADAGALHDQCVLVHAINVTKEEVDSIAEAGASVVWCPSSNLFLFGRTAPVAAYVERDVNLMLGTDSPCSGSGSLRRELPLAAELLAKELRLDVGEAWKQCFRLVTRNFGRVFRGSGTRLEAGGPADFVLFRAAPAGSTGPIDLTRPPRLVVRQGRALLAPRVATANGLVPLVLSLTSTVAQAEDEVVVIGAPQELLLRLGAASGSPPDFFPLQADLEAM